MLAATLTLSVIEIVLLLFGAIILGITIHFFIASKRSLKATEGELKKSTMVHDEWKLRYFNDMELRDKEMAAVKQQLMEAEENANIYSTEAEELSRQLKKLESENISLQKTISETPAPLPPAAPEAAPEEQKPEWDYLEQLKQTQAGLVEQNLKINQLLDNIDFIKEKEEMHREILRINEELSAQVNAMRLQLTEKEIEISNSRQKEQLANEMKSMLDSTYTEFSTLQSKIQKLESQLNSSRMVNMELEDIKEAHSKMSKDFEEQKIKINTLAVENKQLLTQVTELDDKLREANFQKQQLQKRMAYLEELNNDLQVVSDSNKKLEAQLRRVGELESMLNVVSEERDQLMQKKGQ